MNANYWTIPGLVRKSDTDYAPTLIRRVERFAGIENIRQRTRRREVCEARQVAAYLLRRDTGFTTSLVGRMLGIDHSSVTHSVQVVDALFTHDREFRSLWGAFIAESGRTVGDNN